MSALQLMIENAITNGVLQSHNDAKVMATALKTLTEMGIYECRVEPYIGNTNPEYGFVCNVYKPGVFVYTDYVATAIAQGRDTVPALDYKTISSEFPAYTAEEHINALCEIATAQYELCFNGNNRDTAKNVASLNSLRLRYGDRLLVNPDEIGPEYFKFAGHNNPKVWSCKGIELIQNRDSGFVGLERFQERFREFTYGMFEKSLNPKMKTFPWENVVVSGGSIMQLVNTDYDPKYSRGSDIDIFPYGKTFEEREAAFNRVLSWFKEVVGVKNKIYYAIRGSVVSIYITDIRRKFQLISSDRESIYGVLRNFDLSHVQWAYDGKRLYCTPIAAKSLRTRLTTFDNIRAVKVERLIKTLLYGYDIEKIVNDRVTDITSIITEKNVQFQDIVRNFNGFYYPQTDQTFTPEDEREYILAMVLRDSNATKSTVDIEAALRDTVVSGDFTQSYAVSDFKSFNTADVKINPLYHTRVVADKHGNIRLSTDNMTVVSCVMGQTDFVITLKPSEEFAEFCKVLDRVYAMHDRTGVSSALCKNGEIVLKIPKRKLEKQVEHGKTMMKSQRGQPLDMEEELRPGDKIQFIFSILLNKLYNVGRFVSLIPTRFVKFVAEEKREFADRDHIIDKDIEDVVCKYEELTLE